MNDAAQMIPLCRTGFYACAVLTAVSGGAAVCMFFRFDIRNIFRIRSRSAEKKSRREKRRAVKNGQRKQRVFTVTERRLFVHTDEEIL